MTLQEYLLAQLAEEAAEVAQASSKACRFGLKDYYKGLTDLDRVVGELNDLMGMVDLLQTEGILPGDLFDLNKIEAKKAKARKWMEHARQLGTLI
jgi:hypothetical protein